MILFQNSVIKLDYEPSTDILQVQYPDLHGYLIPEVKHSIDTLLETVRSYDVKNLLLDSSNSTSSVNEVESREIASYLAAGLVNTRLKKLARVQSLVAEAEQRTQGNIQHIQSTLALPFMLRNFSDSDTALDWLKSEE
ncbi:hypothetical protein [Rufibacter sp. LB8]|uniref:hypothetical protein n=1 Tax=Rufibacter sp. LB8 TaxID=2777781 RepID=UPI00178C27C5|nr:hypothetical protein [Rufibacter sp. LB8]